ncbi:MAG TPA: YkgJ family cysteine cluster protein [Acetobacteraceae bacterium]|nr:YkgJ family cysteine cluster protein [Acetobacteraceae bacterium]
MSDDSKPLDCLRCPAFCCKIAGYVEVSEYDIRRLAKFLGLTKGEFEAQHIVERTRRGKKHIKSEFETCQFLDARRRCTVYAARPTDCRGYHCWDAEDQSVYRAAAFVHVPVRAQQKEDRENRK